MGRNMPLDAARGLAVFLMLIFHLAVDLEDFFGCPTGYRHGWWQALRYFTVMLFIGVSGWTAGANTNGRARRGAFRALAGALLVSAATYSFLGESYVRFGILHFLSCALFLAPLLRGQSDFSLFLAAAFSVAAGWLAPGINTGAAYLLPFGVTPQGFHSVDYYPLFPWLAAFIAGLAAGRRRAPLKARPCGNPAVRAAAFLGKRSLFIYLAHQPLFLLFLYAMMG
ncbi:MAG: DUF1624 domain-containing protein [Acidaminococcales bacterium]|nr:DUF1624 domain-containing protein [Acidaminococcales bacterium]